MTWTLDRSLTSFEDTVPLFLDVIKENLYVQQSFVKMAERMGKGLKAVKNSYAAPIFRLGIAYQVEVKKVSTGQTGEEPSAFGLEAEEYRLTETARLWAWGEIDAETFFLVNAIRYQALNSTVQEKKFTALKNAGNQVLPLFLCLQVLRELMGSNPAESFLTENEINWLSEKMTQTPADISNYANQLVQARTSKTPLTGTGSYIDAFMKWFHATRVVISLTNTTMSVSVKGRVMVLAADRAMVVDKILADPPAFFDIPTFDDRWKWAAEYIKAPANLDMYRPPNGPLILKLDLPASASYDQATGALTLPWPQAAGLRARDGSRKGNLIAIKNCPSGLSAATVYEVDSITFPGNGTGQLKLAPAMRSADPNVNVAEQIEQMP